MHNVHDTGGPVLVHTRWAMNYLRGPLTRQQVGELMAEQRREIMQKVAVQPANGQPSRLPQQTGFPAPPPSLPGQTSAAPPPPPSVPGFSAQSAQIQVAQPQQPQPVSRGPQGYTMSQPAVPSSIAQYFLAPAIGAQQALMSWQQRTGFSAAAVPGLAMAYQPTLLAQAAIRYSERKANIFTARYYAYRIDNLDKQSLIHWEEHEIQPVDTRSIGTAPAGNAIFGELAPGLTDNKRMTTLKKELVDVLYNTVRLHIPYNPSLKVYGDPNAEDSEFLAQSAQTAREQRDADIDKVTSKYEVLMDKLEDKRIKEERDLGQERQELADRKREQLFTQGEAFLSLLRGRTTYTLSRSSRATRFARQSEADLTESQQVLQDIDQEMDELEQRFQQELRQVNEKWAAVAADVQEYLVTPYKKDIHVELFGVGWIPFYYTEVSGQQVLLPAF
jgi:hypothetical protein